jgi:hypothetical protein
MKTMKRYGEIPRAVMKHAMRIAFCFMVAMSAYVASAPSALSIHSAALAQSPTTINFGRSCFNVLAFNADPTGQVDAAPAFRSAFTAASQQNGGAVCAPAGTFLLSGEITLINAAVGGSQGGPSFFGAGPGLTVLQETGTGSVFDSCPTYSDVTPNMPIPTPCPALSLSSSGMPNPHSPLNGVVFANFSINIAPAMGTMTGSAFYFPVVAGLLVDNVSVTGSATNIFDFGQRTPQSFGDIVVRDNTVETQYARHYLALHGGGDGLTVERSENRGGAAKNQQSILFDSSDIVGGTVSHMRWLYDDFEGPFLGFFAFLPGGSAPAAAILDSEFKGNIFDHCFVACYYFAVDTGQSSPPAFGNLQLADRWTLSNWTSVLMDGGYYTTPGAGVQGIKISGPSLYGGSVTGKNGQGGSLSMIAGSGYSTGFTHDGTAIAVLFGNGIAVYAKAVASDTANSLAAKIAFDVGNATAPPASQALNGSSASLANPNYGDISIQLAPTAGPAFTPLPYTIITTGILHPVDAAGMTCPVPTPIALSGGAAVAPCATGAIDLGDGVSLQNSAREVDVVGARVKALAGASVHIGPGGADRFHILNNGLGEDKNDNSLIGLRIDAGATNPQSYDIEFNDFSGATIPLMLTAPPPATITATAPTMRNNRGAIATIVAATPVSNSALTLLTLTNPGPLDCTYYFSGWSGPVTGSTLSLPGSTAALPTAEPSGVRLPVGATLTVTASGATTATVTYVGFCQP